MTEEVRKFYRSRTDRVIFGVCGGLGDYFKIDSILFRLFFVMLVFMNGVGIPLYIIMTIITPEEPGRDKNESGLEGEVNELAEKIDQKAKELGVEMKKKNVDAQEEEMTSSRNLFGALIVVFGIFFLLREIFPPFGISNNAIGAMAIIAVGLLVVFKR